jgi:hypothetical protein
MYLECVRIVTCVNKALMLLVKEVCAKIERQSNIKSMIGFVHGSDRIF